MAADLGTAFIEGVAQFAGTFTNPVVALAVVGLAWLVRGRTACRLAGAAVGAGLALAEAWATGGLSSPAGGLAPPAAAAVGGFGMAAAVIMGGALAALLQVELMLGLVLPLLALFRRAVDAVLGLFRTPTSPPGP